MTGRFVTKFPVTPQLLSGLHLLEVEAWIYMSHTSTQSMQKHCENNAKKKKSCVPAMPRLH